MELHQRQQFDFLLMTAVERYVERLTQRNAGAENALNRLRQDPQGDGIWLNQFVDAIFQDFLLDNAGGACFVLNALAKRKIAAPPAGRVQNMLVTMAKSAFADLLGRKTEELLEQTIMYSGVMHE